MFQNFSICPCTFSAGINRVFQEANPVTLSIDNMAIKTVVSDVGHSALEPSVHVLMTRVNSCVPTFEPMKLIGFSLEKGTLVFD